MESFPIASVFLLFLFFIPSTSTTAPLDIITHSVSIKDGESIVSSGGSFELGFFSPGSSRNRYLGIWYKDVSPRIVVWVCNKEAPITDHSRALNLTGHGGLVLFSGTKTIVWSSSNKTSTNICNPVARLQVAQLLESGNFVVRDGSNEDSKSQFLWQSFDYPSDTLLAGTKIGWASKTDLNRFLSSWKEAEDPFPGPFSYSVDRSGYPQVVLRNGSMVYYRLGSWNGLSFSGLSTRNTYDLSKLHFVLNENEVCYP